MMRKLSLIFSVAAVALCGSTAHAATPAKELVYDNTTTYLERFGTEVTEYGDELNLAGSSRVVTDFVFRYFGDFTQTGDEFARIRFYKNDVPLSQNQIAPGTLLWTSTLFGLNPGNNTRVLSVPNIEVPGNFTFTIQFQGMSQQAGDRAGLLMYDPPTVGTSFNDFWRKREDGEWRLVRYDVRNNFAARVLAVPEPAVLSLAAAGLAFFLFRRRA
ncbi:MAG: PEP-CTERM sorting domain-containing protein [Verrucomicrobiales bacterium]